MSIKYYLFGDERQKHGKFTLATYIVDEETSEQVPKHVQKYLNTHSMGRKTVFHYTDDSPRVRRLFSRCISKLPPIHIYRAQTTERIFPVNYITCIEEIVTQIASDFPDSVFIPFFDQIGGKKSEVYLRTQFGRIARKNKLHLHKPLRFLSAKKSLFIQIADYIAAGVGN
jgi:hypothetical protein